jgi:hypothetical protein
MQQLEWVGSDLLTAVFVKSSFLWEVTPFIPLCLEPASHWFLAWIILRPWRWRRRIARETSVDFSTDYKALCLQFQWDLMFSQPLTVNSIIVYDMTSHNLVNIYRRFSRTSVNVHQTIQQRVSEYSVRQEVTLFFFHTSNRNITVVYLIDRVWSAELKLDWQRPCIYIIYVHTFNNMYNM